jgi:signal transduction histidine kinase
MRWREWGWPKASGLAPWLAGGIFVSVALLAWFGFSASREWRRSSVLLVERRADESARLLVTALSRDMRAVQMSILSAAAWNDFSFDSPQDVTMLVASAFARYPYPEAFLASVSADPLKLAFFTRADRPPSWVEEVREPNLFPVRLVTDEATSSSLAARIRSDAALGWPFSIFEIDLGGTTYQIIVRLHYRDQLHQRLSSVAGFMVNTAWARQYYFPELTRQIAIVGGTDPQLVFGIVDDRGADVVPAKASISGGLVSRRSFPVAFFDPALVAVNPAGHLTLREWTVFVSAGADPALAAADVTVFLTAAAAVALAIGLVMTARAMRASADLADMRAEFMSSVTHELKTPISSIQVLGDTLSRGRLPTSAARREYGALVVQEAKRLARLVDNLLAHARITDIADVYSFEPVHVDVIVDAALSGFSYQLRQAQFALSVDVPASLPPILADLAAMELVFDNLIDNAIRYSPETKELRISAESHGDMVSITFSDRGVGIEKDDLERVTQKFVRGRNAAAGGSGLGLAIAKRIVVDHHGELSIESELHEGTVVTLNIPTAVETLHSRPPAVEADAFH